MTPRPTPGTPLYLHVPYCAAKCPYCDFYSVVGTGRDLARLVDDLLAEAELRAPRHPRTVFAGGGTPSYLAPAELERLFDGLDRATGFRRSASEVTVECNPESLDRAKAERVAELGATRLSIGLQSLRPAALVLFGRIHTVERGLEAVRARRAAGLPEVSADLIYAWPGQDVAGWREDLARVLDLGVDHLSAYNLTYEEGTPFAADLAAGRLERAPEELELALFEATREVTAAYGLEAYEVSNFARPGHRCRHNVNYWRNGPYVGLGPSAVSRVGTVRFGNPRSVTRWRGALARGAAALAEWREELSPRARLGETWWLGLRLAEGVGPSRARRTAGWTGPGDPALERAGELVRLGLLQRNGPRYQLSRRGLPLADAVGREFLAPAEEAVA